MMVSGCIILTLLKTIFSNEFPSRVARRKQSSNLLPIPIHSPPTAKRSPPWKSAKRITRSSSFCILSWMEKNRCSNSISAAGRVGCRRNVGVGAGEIPAARAHLIALMIGHFDADFVVAAVEDVVRRQIGDGILVAQFVADVLERLVQIVHVIRKKRAPAGFFGHFLVNLVPVGQVILAVAQLVRIGLRK